MHHWNAAGQGERGRLSMALMAASWPLYQRAGEAEDSAWIVTFLLDDPLALAAVVSARGLGSPAGAADLELEPLSDTSLWVASFSVPARWHTRYALAVHHGPGEPEWRAVGSGWALRRLVSRARVDPRRPGAPAPECTLTATPDAPPPAAPAGGYPRGL
ncbi:hypothetical protein [Mycetocola spongiae]|uniref:hypothetical protein n=1 Tax=Mycetocola spongiae TaxID=2859226 RepID=UPI001CF5E519|nr:hypothetical protein [Mycetocola spongiae]UCR88886.1 hypothetical protein KXZ72_13195 [Mycetocola spongiae]